ncbi:aldehyde dehydrogenase family protein, partial [Marinitenerispora sediminis]
VELANLPGYGLSSAIYTRDPAKVYAFRAGIGAGMVSVNNSTSGAEAHLPFGGNGRSGNGGRLSGIWVLDQFTRW